MVEWYHQHNGHEFEQSLGDSEGQGSLVCCSPWGCKELDTTERLNSNDNPMRGAGLYLEKYSTCHNCSTITLEAGAMISSSSQIMRTVYRKVK